MLQGNLAQFPTSFFIGRRKERLHRRSFSVARKGMDTHRKDGEESWEN